MQGFGAGVLRKGILFLLLLVGAVGCDQSPGHHDTSGGNGAAAKAEKSTDKKGYTIVCTIGMVTDLVKQIAGERAKVTGLIRPGIDPHLYKPTRTDIEIVLAADVVFYNGLLLEGKMTDLLSRAATMSGEKVYPVTELLADEIVLKPEALQGVADPHVWMDPSAWSKTVPLIRDKLIAFDPQGESVYKANAQKLVDAIGKLDAYADKVLKSVPEKQRVLVTAHDAFNYFGRRFGYEVVGIQGLSTESEAGVQDLEQLVDLLVTRKIGAVFVESTVTQRNINALIEGARARGHEVKIGGELFSDAMGADGTYVGTYIGMIDHNVTTVAKALGGKVPEKGMQGALTLEH